MYALHLCIKCICTRVAYKVVWCFIVKRYSESQICNAVCLNMSWLCLNVKWLGILALVSCSMFIESMTREAILSNETTLLRWAYSPVRYVGPTKSTENIRSVLEILLLWFWLWIWVIIYSTLHELCYKWYTLKQALIIFLQILKTIFYGQYAIYTCFF